MEESKITPAPSDALYHKQGAYVTHSPVPTKQISSRFFSNQDKFLP